MVGFGYGRKSSVRLDTHAKLPDPRMPNEDEWITKSPKQLEVPNQLGPELGVARPDTIGMAQMFPGLVVCPDGTMMDMKSGRVVVDPSKNAPAGQWAPTKIISPPQATQSSTNSWNSQSMSTSSSSFNGNASLNDVDSMKYWQDQAIAAQKQQGPMTDTQKKLLADLEAGKLMKLSRLELVDENLKNKNKLASKSI